MVKYMEIDDMVQLKDFEKLVHESAEALSKVIAQEQAPEKNLLPAAVREKKIQQEIEAHTKSMQKKMEEGLKACLLSLGQCQNLPMKKEAVVEELKGCFAKIDSPEALAELGKAALTNTSWKAHLAISDNCMESLYQSAKALFDAKSYDDAEKAFFVLCALDPTIFAYWVGFGHTSFHQNNYQQAVNGYGMASTLNPEDIWPHIWAGNSFEKQGERDYAKMALGEALNLEKAKPSPDRDIVSSLESRIQQL